MIADELNKYILMFKEFSRDCIGDQYSIFKVPRRAMRRHLSVNDCMHQTLLVRLNQNFEQLYVIWSESYGNGIEHVFVLLPYILSGYHIMALNYLLGILLLFLIKTYHTLYICALKKMKRENNNKKFNCCPDIYLPNCLSVLIIRWHPNIYRLNWCFIDQERLAQISYSVIQ